MRFDEFDGRPPKKKKVNTTFIAVGIFVIVFLLVILLFGKSLFSSTPEKKEPTSTITVDSRISKLLYRRVHDFDTRNPFWMYSDESLGLISEMKESTKMSLVYINLNYNDFKVIDCPKLAEDEENDNYECSGSTLMINKDILESNYEELFGLGSKMSTSAIVKADKNGNQAYFYNSDKDAYILYSRKKPIEEKSNYIYKFEFMKATLVEDKILLYEVVSEKDLTTKKIKKNKYIYTFVKDEDGLYNFYSIEKEA